MEKLENKELGVNFFSFSTKINNAPTFKDHGRKEWISYGEDNLYPNYLVELLNSSSDHNAIIKRKVDMAVGNGFVKTPELEKFLLNEYGKKDMDSIVYRLGYDLLLYGAFSYLVTWSNDGESIARVTYMPLSKVRIARDVEQKDDPERFKRQEAGVEFYYISEDWGNTRKSNNKPRLIQGFSEEFNDVKTQLVYVTEYRPSYEYYTLPDYISGIDWIELDKEVGNYHLNSVQNGFTPSMIISFNGGIPTAEEQEYIAKNIKKEYAGTDNASKVFITFSEGGDKKPDFTPVQLNDSDERFILLNEQISTKIMTAHRANPIVSGIQTAGKLGSTDEVFEQEELFMNNVIKQKQHIIENSFNKLTKINGLPNVELFDIVKERKIEDQKINNNTNEIIEG